MHNWALAAVTATLLGFAALSGRLRGTPITAAMVFVAVGFVVGSDGFGLITDTGSSEATIRLFAEATLTLVLFADAARIDLRALGTEYVVPVRLLGIGLPLTIAIGSLIAAVLFGALDISEAVIIGVLLAPTDAALGQAVVTDQRVPSRIRQGLNVESGLNDGICVPLLYIALAVAEAESATHASDALRLVCEAIGYGVLGGILAGALGGTLMLRAGDRGWIDRAWKPLLPVAAAGLAYGIAAPLGGSGFIAAFVGGIVFGHLTHDEQGDDTYLTEQIGGALNGVTFILFGALILAPTLHHLSWSIAIYAVLSLTVVRMLPVAIAMAGTHARPQTLGFVGWFGPRGLASIVFAVIVVEGSDLPHVGTILAATSATVALSVFAHGVTSQPLTDRYIRWYQSHPRGSQPQMESAEAPDQRWRRTAVSPQ